MTRGLGRACAGALVAALAAAADAGHAETAAPVVALRIDGAIGPATAELVSRGLARAALDRAQLVVLEIDTPGGLDGAMRSIIKDILASSVPVAAFVSPQGARAASAGTYILYAAHVAAMAPATNLGAATPIAIGLPTPGVGGNDHAARPASAASASAAGAEDASGAKRVNDASAYIRSLAQLRGRNTAWAEQAVRESVSLSAGDALARGVIDLVATDRADLLRQLDGRTVATGQPAPNDSVRLATAHAPVTMIEPDARGRLLAVLSDPSLVLLLMMIGVYGLLFEFMSPGYVAPGVSGGVSLLLALWGLQMLPVTYAGLALLLLGIAFLVAEAFVPSYGALGIGGVVAFGLGGLLLIDGDVPGFGIPPLLIGGATVTLGLGVAGLVTMAARARRRPVVSGTALLVGATAEVIEFDAGEGWALVDGERWHVRSARPLRVGERVRIARVSGLTLEVDAPADPAPTPQGGMA